MATDDELLGHLRRVAADADGVPELASESARAAFGTRRLDDQLAQLIRDSDLTATVTVRSTQAEPRRLSYQSGEPPAELSLELQVTSDTDGISLRGFVVGSRHVTVEPVAGAPQPVDIDERGRFALTGLPLRTFRIFRVRMTGLDATSVTTGWIRV